MFRKRRLNLGPLAVRPGWRNPFKVLGKFENAASIFEDRLMRKPLLCQRHKPGELYVSAEAFRASPRQHDFLRGLWPAGNPHAPRSRPEQGCIFQQEPGQRPDKKMIVLGSMLVKYSLTAELNQSRELGIPTGPTVAEHLHVCPLCVLLRQQISLHTIVGSETCDGVAEGVGTKLSNQVERSNKRGILFHVEG